MALAVNAPLRSSHVLVTGATGFVGRTLVRRLLEQQCGVNTLARHLEEAGPDSASCHQFAGDITDVALLRQACQGVDTVFHLAAYAHVNRHELEEMRRVNVDGTRALLDACVAAGVRRLVYFSSVLAESPSCSAYGRAKRDAENLLLEAAQRGDIEVCCLRPVNVYGVGMKGNLRTLVRFMAKGWMPPLPVPSATFSLVGSQDLCEAALLAARHPLANGKIYTVTDGRTYSFKGLERTVRNIMGKPSVRWQMPMPVFWLGFALLEVLGRVLRMSNAPGLRSYAVLTQDSVVSCEKLQRDLGYNPAGAFHEELPTLVQRLLSE